MTIAHKLNKLPLIGLLVSIMVLTLTAATSAHVVVKPAEVVTAGFVTFTIGVPNEKTIPTTSVKLAIPEGLHHVSPTQKSGWEISTEKQGQGESATIQSITWSGNTIGDGFRDEFTFSAQVPEKATELQWKAYQTYADGTVVSWDKKDEGGHGARGNSGPFSVTKVVTETEQQVAQKNVEAAAADAKSTADRSLYVGVAGVLLSLVAIALATRKTVKK